jgi:hypothetical protein
MDLRFGLDMVGEMGFGSQLSNPWQPVILLPWLREVEDTEFIIGG